MAKIVRYDGNLLSFGSGATGTERTVFGDVAQSDLLDDNINADFFRGWGIIGVNDVPPKQDFNAVAYTLGQLLAYIHQIGVAEWNVTQEYHEHSFANVSGALYKSKSNSNVGNNPVADDGTNWEIAFTTADNGLYNGRLTINQKDIVLDAAAVSATNDVHSIDMHKTTLSGVTGTHQLLSSGQPLGTTGNSLKHAATSSASGQIGSRQIITNFGDRAGLTETQSRWVKSNSADARLILDDGVSKTASTAHTGGGAWELLTVTATLSASATKLDCYAVIASATLTDVAITSGDYVEFADARLDHGNFRLSGNRETPIELELCRQNYRRRTATSIGDSVITGLVFNANTMHVTTPGRMRAAPVIAVSGITINDTAVAVPIASYANIVNAEDAVLFQITASASTLTPGNGCVLRSTTATGYIEFNAEP